MTTSTKEIDFPGEDEAAGTTGTATVEAATAPPAEPGVAPAEQPDCPPPPVTHQHPDGTTHVGIECSGGCPK